MSRGTTHPLRVGEQLGNLRLNRLIGEGGMGAVYEAQHVILGRRQAVKLLHAELASDPYAYARFRREAQIAASLESDHVVPVREYGNANDGTPYLVMDLLRGEDLATILDREAPLAVTRAVDLMRQACLGLKAAHEHDPCIVHRDLKPENLFICLRDEGGELLKILDFGIAKLLEPDPVGPTTRTGSVVGTPHYMSPEQAEDVRAVDQRTDIYSLGVIVYEALSRHKAHPGGSYNEIIAHILLKNPIPLELLREDLPAELVAIVQRAMQADPSERFQSVAQMGEAVLELQAHKATRPRSIVLLRAARPPQDPDLCTLDSALQPVVNIGGVADSPQSTPPCALISPCRAAGKGTARGTHWLRTLTASAALLSAGVGAFWRPWVTAPPTKPVSLSTLATSREASQVRLVPTSSSTFDLSAPSSVTGTADAGVSHNPPTEAHLSGSTARRKPQRPARLPQPEGRHSLAREQNVEEALDLPPPPPAGRIDLAIAEQ